MIGCSQKDMKLSETEKIQIEKEINHAFANLVDISTTLDSTRYFELIDKDKFVGLNANGQNWNNIEDLKAIIIPAFDMVKKIESINFTNVKISVIDKNTAILVNEYNQTIMLDNGQIIKDSGGGTQVWSKSSGHWLLVSISASSKSHE